MASGFEAPKKLINKLPDLQKWQKSEVSCDKDYYCKRYHVFASSMSENFKLLSASYYFECCIRGCLILSTAVTQGTFITGIQ